MIILVVYIIPYLAVSTIVMVIAIKCTKRIWIRGIVAVALFLIPTYDVIITNAHGKTYFDLYNNKFAENTSWIDKNDGILINKTLIANSITNGSELFGNHTLLRDGSLANNGFEALKEFANLNLLVA
jgi:hypothetical protein